MTSWAMCENQNVIRVELHIPQQGAWWAELDFELAPVVSGRVTLMLGSVRMVCTVFARDAGSHALSRKVRVIGGNGGWGTLVATKDYANDLGVSAITVINDAAREAGETMAADLSPEVQTLGLHYVREVGPASRVLEEAIGSASWWVDFDGVTHVGTRATSEPDHDSYQVIDYNPREHIVTLALTNDDISLVPIGARLAENLDEAQVVREIRVSASSDVVRMIAQCVDVRKSRLADSFSSLVDRLTDTRIHGLWKYRVVRMSSDRVELQIVERARGVPDILPISMWPGIAGAHADLTPGAHVIVQFINGSRREPVITHFSGKDGTGWSPVNLTIDATTLIKIGKDATALAARADLTDQRISTIQSSFDGHTHIYNVATGPGVTTQTPTASAPPAAPIGALASVACDKVKVQ